MLKVEKHRLEHSFQPQVYTGITWRAVKTGRGSPRPEQPLGRAQQAPARLGFPGALPQRRVVWMWFGAFPGARASSAKTRGFHTQLDEGPETP